ncbi:hypothetical protein [Longimicrobium sp.]|uniref:hypothetical protein n=1 Tax=Longimicrobium sp. TaxID=2029185 RepID=UPI002BED2472|nr:hypothetical protein [Longimicrobium sp.]HSU17856.1 hypothetical protein [Longimicrobium sp.]
MKKKALLPAAALAVLLTTLACREPLDIGGFSVSGQWAGTAKQLVGADSVAYSVVMDLDQNRRAVTGTATVRAGTDSVRTDVTGTWDYPRVSLRLSAPEFADLQYNAQFTPQENPDTLAGPLIGSGFTNATLKLVRQ